MSRALFISDLHLASERPDTNLQFFRFLGDEATRAQALYVLGDLFEYWAGDDELQGPAGDPLAADVAAAFKALSGRGVQVSIMHGNRDFLLAAEFCNASGSSLLPDPSVVDMNGAGTLLMHGDTLCTDDRDYQAWRATARSASWQRDFLARPLAERHAAVGALREKSKQVIAAKPAEIMDVNTDAVRDAFRRHNVRRLIHGHTHRPARHEVEVDGARCERWVLPDWYGRGGYLALDDVGPRLVSFWNSPKAFAALRHPGYRGYFAGAAMAMMADSIEHVISYWIMFEKFQSPALAGFAVVSHWLPFLLFSVWSGALADRFDPRRIIQVGMGLFMLASLGWGLLFLSDSLEMWHAVVLLVIHGLAGVLWNPAGQLLIHDIVDDKLLHSAIRLSATARWLGLLMGPAVGGGILLLLGPAWGILFNVLIYLPFIFWLQRNRFAKKSTAARRIRGFSDIVSTAGEIRANRVIVAMILLAGAASLIVGNAYQAQMPEFAHHLGHADGGITYSTLFAADAAGALAAGLLLESRGLLPARVRTAFVLAMLWCLAIGGFALSNSYALALALLFAAGFLELSFNTMAQTLVQVHAPAEARGRVIGLFAMSSLGLRAFSGITVGLGGALVGIHWSLAASAALLLGIIAALLAFTWKTR